MISITSNKTSAVVILAGLLLLVYPNMACAKTNKTYINFPEMALNAHVRPSVTARKLNTTEVSLPNSARFSIQPSAFATGIYTASASKKPGMLVKVLRSNLKLVFKINKNINFLITYN